MTVRVLPGVKMTDWDSFHTVSQQVFGFPDFYGRNGNAWIDCLTYIHKGDGMSNVILEGDELLFIHVTDSAVWASVAEEVYLAFLDFVAWVNQRSIDDGVSPRLALMLL